MIIYCRITYDKWMDDIIVVQIGRNSCSHADMFVLCTCPLRNAIKQIRRQLRRIQSWGQILSPWKGDKVDSGIGLPMVCIGVEFGVDIRWGYSQLRHRVPYTPCFSLDSASDANPIFLQNGGSRFFSVVLFSSNPSAFHIEAKKDDSK